MHRLFSPHSLAARSAGVLLSCLAPVAASAVEIDLQPSDYLYLNRIDAAVPLYDVLLGGLRLRNPEPEAVDVIRLEVRASDDQGRLAIRRLTAADLGMERLELSTDEPVGLRNLAIRTDFPPTRIEIALECGRDGRHLEVVANLPVRDHHSEIAYGYPLRGTWYMRGIPSLLSHHRYSLATEFAVDFFEVDGEGRVFDGDPIDAASYYGFGEPVLAAADGTVEMVIAGMEQDRAARMRRPGESDEEFSRRIGELNRQATEEHGLGGATGNLVVLSHPNGERTAYGHLAAGSVTVAIGDTVRRGQPIGAVGDTGDSATVHLHFQVMEGEAMRSIPFRFEGLEVISREYGSWVRPAPTVAMSGPAEDGPDH